MDAEDGPRTALKRVILAAQEKLYQDRCEEKWRREKLSDRPNEQCSALELAEWIKTNDLEDAWVKLAEEFEEKDVIGLNGK